MVDVKQLITHCDDLFAKQSNWRHTWQDVSDYVYPVKSNIETTETPGEVRATERYDTTAEEALLDFAAGLVGWLTPVGESWFRFEPRNKNASDASKVWFKKCTERATEALFSSNFYLSWHEGCIDAGAFGTIGMFVEHSPEKLLNFMSWPIGTYAYCVNADGDPDYVFRKWKWTARQAVNVWGVDKVTEPIRKAYEEGGANAEKEFEFAHAIYNRQKGEYLDGEAAGERRPIASVYIDYTNKKLIEEDGYYEWPAPVGRLLKSNSENYGRSPAMGVLPEIKMLNRMEMDLLVGLEKMVNPSWLMPSDSDYEVDNRPDGITYWNATNPNAKPEQLQLNNRIDLAEGKTEQKRERIRKAFFNDMFQMVTQIGMDKATPPTATQIQAMVEERIALFTPIFARMIQEVLNPLLERVFGILFRAGEFPEMPPELLEEGGEYDITYVSRIAMAIKSLQNGQLMQALEFIRGFMEIDPSARFWLKTSKAGRGALMNLSLPSDWLNTEDEINEMIAQEQEQQRQAQMMEMMKTGAQAAGAMPPELVEQLGKQ